MVLDIRSVLNTKNLCSAAQYLAVATAFRRLVCVNAEQQASEEQQFIPLIIVLNYVIDKSDLRCCDAENNQNEGDEGCEPGNWSIRPAERYGYLYDPDDI
jgi:hypothetical protein